MKWLLVKDVAELLGINARNVQKKLTGESGRVETRNYHFEYKFIKGKKGVSERALRKDHYEIALESLPDDVQTKYVVDYVICNKDQVQHAPVPPGITKNIKNEELQAVVERDNGVDTYNDAPKWQRDLANMRYRCINDSVGLKGAELATWVKKVWNVRYPNDKISVKTLYRWRKAYKDTGLGGLIPLYGTANNTRVRNNGKYETFGGYYTRIKPELYKIFKEMYLNQGAPSVESCWEAVIGYAAINDSEYQFAQVPSKATFSRAVLAEYGARAVYRARYGAWKYNKKYGYYISRDASDVKPGDVWVSDHAQLDVMCMGDDGKPHAPWVTVWQDFKTGKWLAWSLYIGNPNSDRIFETFYKAACSYGLPKEILIDNGKDYRSKDFAGGRPKARSVKIKIDEKDEHISMTERMGIVVHFALPYNGQAKPIERGFNTQKEALSRHQIGFRGGNVVERPEILQEYITKGLIPNIHEFRKRYNRLIPELINNKKNNGKYHQGRSRNKMWEDECEGLRMIDKDELRLFCMRTSKPLRIGKNGVTDRVDNLTYYASWMVSKQVEYVYLRRDPLNYQEAWVYDMQDKFIDVAYLVTEVAAFARDEVSRAELKEASRVKRNAEKIVREAEQIKSFTPTEQDDYMITGVLERAKAAGQLPEDVTGNYTGVPSETLKTDFADALKKKEYREKQGQYDDALFVPQVVKQTEIDIWAGAQ